MVIAVPINLPWLEPGTYTESSTLEARCREAAAGTAPVGFDVQWPHTRRWYRFRLVPVPDGLAWYFTDITESRLRQAEQEALHALASLEAVSKSGSRRFLVTVTQLASRGRGGT